MEYLKTKEEYLKTIENSNNLIIKFTASWCPPCLVIQRSLDEISENNPDIDIVYVDVDDADEIMDYVNIRNIPTVYIYIKSELKKTFIGLVSKEELLKPFIDNE